MPERGGICPHLSDTASGMCLPSCFNPQEGSLGLDFKETATVPATAHPVALFNIRTPGKARQRCLLCWTSGGGHKAAALAK